jgi:hypothetical protein
MGARNARKTVAIVVKNIRLKEGLDLMGGVQKGRVPISSSKFLQISGAKSGGGGL